MGNFFPPSGLFALQLADQKTKDRLKQPTSLPDTQERRRGVTSTRLILPPAAKSRLPVVEYHLFTAICRIKVIDETGEVRSTLIGINARFKFAFPQE